MEKRKNGRIAESKVKEGLYKLLADVFSVLSNATRIRMLHILLPHSPPPRVTFSEIMFAVRKNPNAVNYHLGKMMEFGMVRKTEDGKYQITEIGELALNADLEDILSITERAIETAKTKGYIVSKD